MGKGTFECFACDMTAVHLFFKGNVLTPCWQGSSLVTAFEYVFLTLCLHSHPTYRISRERSPGLTASIDGGSPWSGLVPSGEPAEGASSLSTAAYN